MDQPRYRRPPPKPSRYDTDYDDDTETSSTSSDTTSATDRVPAAPRVQVAPRVTNDNAWAASLQRGIVSRDRQQAAQTWDTSRHQIAKGWAAFVLFASQWLEALLNSIKFSFNCVRPILVGFARVFGVIAVLALLGSAFYLMAALLASVCTASDTLSSMSICRTWIAPTEAPNIPIIELASNDAKFFEAAEQISNLDPMVHLLLKEIDYLGQKVSSEVSQVELNPQHYIASDRLLKHLDEIRDINIELSYKLLPKYVSSSRDVRVQFVAGLDLLAYSTQHHVWSKVQTSGTFDTLWRYIFENFPALAQYTSAGDIDRQFYLFAQHHAPGMRSLRDQCNEILYMLLKEENLVTSYISEIEAEVAKGHVACPSPVPGRLWGSRTPKPIKGLEVYCAAPMDEIKKRLEQLSDFVTQIQAFQKFLQTYLAAIVTIQSSLSSISDRLDEEARRTAEGGLQYKEYRVARIWEAIQRFQDRIAQISATEEDARSKISRPVLFGKAATYVIETSGTTAAATVSPPRPKTS